jgi:methylthioribulose-1-phosphate dehydratase
LKLRTQSSSKTIQFEVRSPTHLGELIMLTGKNLKLAEELLETIWFFNQKGWSPATTTNYSVRTENPLEIIISRSGVDKSKFTIDDIILINLEGAILPPYNKPGVKSSAETDLHLDIYNRFPEVRCVLHTHSVLGTVLSRAWLKNKEIPFEGWEILKAFDGNMTHELRESLPIVPNSQVMSEIIENMKDRFEKNVHGYLIAGHGLYSWGKDIPTAKRHIETFEYLFECLLKMRGL